MKKNVTFGNSLILKGIPIVECINDGCINIGNHVTLYSSKRRYFSHISSPVRLFVEEGGIINIGNNTRINGSTIHARNSITIGDSCLIAANTSIVDSNGHKINMKDPIGRVLSKDNARPVVIEDNVWIGMNCIILKGVTIGTGSVIGAGCVIRKDIHKYCIVKNDNYSIVEKI